MFHVLFGLALLPHAAALPVSVSVGAAGTLRTEVIAPDESPAADQKLLRRELPEDQAALAEQSTDCEDGQTAYAVLSDGNLAVISMGPKLPSGRTEVRRLTQSTQYEHFKEDSPIATYLHATGSMADDGEWTFLSDGDDNLLGVNCGMSKSGMTEVHRLKYAGNPPWQALDVNVITALPKRTTFDEWDFLLDSDSNLVVVKKGPSTKSGQTEILKLAATQGYQGFLLGSAEKGTPTGLGLSASTSNNGDWAFLLDGADNLICIRRPSLSEHSIVIKRLTAGSNYHSFDLAQGGAALPYAPDNNADVHWVFEIDLADDILAIKEGPKTLHGYTEIHKLSKASGYTKFTMHQEKSGAPCRNPFFTDAGGIR